MQFGDFRTIQMTDKNLLGKVIRMFFIYLSRRTRAITRFSFAMHCIWLAEHFWLAFFAFAGYISIFSIKIFSRQ